MKTKTVEVVALTNGVLQLDERHLSFKEGQKLNWPADDFERASGNNLIEAAPVTIPKTSGKG